MKKLCLSLLALLSITYASATILTISNEPSQPAQYTDITTAIAAASAGDTLYIHPSSLSYGGNIQVDKQLVIIGTGRAPQKDRPQAAVLTGTLILNAGSDGSQILGIFSNSSLTSNAPVNNILVQGCFIRGLISTNSTNSSGWIIKDCILRADQGTVNPYAFFMTNSSNFLIENCVIGGSMRNFTNSTFRHNIFIKNSSVFGSIFSGSCGGNLFENNIFYGVNVQNQGGNTYNNNLHFGTSNDTIPANNITNNNIIGQNPEFVDAPLTVVNIEFRTHDFRFLATSPAVGAGVNGVDLGITGGNSPATKSGEPYIPQIRSMILDNTIVPAGGNIQVQLISTKAEGQ
ncbi:MAG: hypothetical protein AAFO91_05500 [Bacteroidota bacterium]